MNALNGSLLDAWLALAGHLWQTSLILGLLFLISRSSRRAPAGFVYSMWVLALAKLFLPLSLLGGWAESLFLRFAPGIGAAAPSAIGPGWRPARRARRPGVGDRALAQRVPGSAGRPSGSCPSCSGCFPTTSPRIRGDDRPNRILP